MTTRLAREMFRIECDKRSVGAYDTFITEEIDYFLSFAIRQFYERRISGFTKDRLSFEQGQKRTQDLMAVYAIRTIPLPQVVNKRGCKHSKIKISDSDDFWHVLSEECTFSKTNDPGDIIHTDVYECTTDNLTSRINNSLGDHIYHAGKIRPLRLFTFEDETELEKQSLGGNKRAMFSELYYIDNSDSIDKFLLYTIEYIKKPGAFGTQIPGYTEANQDDEIYQVYSWDDVMSIAVLHALENASSPRVGSYAQEQQIIL